MDHRKTILLNINALSVSKPRYDTHAQEYRLLHCAESLRLNIIYIICIYECFAKLLKRAIFINYIIGL